MGITFKNQITELDGKIALFFDLGFIIGSAYLSEFKIKIGKEETIFSYQKDDIEIWLLLKKTLQIPSDIEFFIHPDYGYLVYHKMGAPAVKNKQVSQWYQNGKKHRIDGPAWEFHQKKDYIYFFDNIRYSEEEYLNLLTKEQKTNFLFNLDIYQK